MRILKNENHIKHLNLFLRKNSVKNIDKKEYSELSYCEEEPVCYNCLSSFPCLLLLKFLGFSVVFFCFVLFLFFVCVYVCDITDELISGSENMLFDFIHAGKFYCLINLFNLYLEEF